MANHVLSPEQLACLASPARSEVYIAFRGRGAISVREAAESLSRTSEAVQYHVRALATVGLLRVAGSRPTKRKPEALYEAPHVRVSLPNGPSGPEVAALTRKAVLAGIRQAARGYVRAAETAAQEPDRRIERHVLRGVFRLRSEDAAKVLEAVEAAFELAKRLESPDGGRIQWSSLFFSDVAPRSPVGSKT